MTRRLLAALVLAAPTGAAVAAGDPLVTYTNTIGPLTARRCHACHGQGSPTLAEFEKDEDGWKMRGKGPRMDTYETLMVFVSGSDAGAIMRRLDDGKNTADGRPGNMYVNLGNGNAERAANLNLVRRWVGEGSWILKKRDQWSDAELHAVRAPR